MIEEQDEDEEESSLDNAAGSGAAGDGSKTPDMIEWANPSEQEQQEAAMLKFFADKVSEYPCYAAEGDERLV